MNKIISLLRTSVTLLILLTLLLGGIYPTVVFGLAQGIFPEKANGSLIPENKKIIGSALLGQEFSKQKYFWSRPSATTPIYNAAGSGGSNLNPGNPKFIEAVKTRIVALQKNGENKKIPIDLVTASGSGLDPHISLAAAEYQIPRVAAARGMKESDVRTLVTMQAQHWLDVSYVNVLKLNMALDEQGTGH
jgi:K+-transporting ATPase ATPase C chain